MANITQYITKEDENAITDTLTALIQSELASAGSPQELVEAVEKSTHEEELSGDDSAFGDNSEEHEENLKEQERKACNEYHEDGTKKSEEELEEETEAGVDLKKNQENTAPLRGSDAKPVTDSDIDKAFEDRKMAQLIELNMYRGEAQLEEAKKAAAAKMTWEDIPTEYKSGCYTDHEGKEIKTKEVRETVNWGEVLSKNATTTDASLERLKDYITYNIKKKFGGWGRIYSIVIRSEQLIFNDTLYLPVIERKYINEDIFPIDTLDFIQNGCLASLFNWKALKKMTNLQQVDIDDSNFYMRTIGGSLYGGQIGVVDIFNVCPSLDLLVLGSTKTTRESLLTKDSVPIKEKVNYNKRFWNFTDGYKLDICKGTNGLQDFTLNNLKNYATSRGNKGLFRYCLGTMARATLFAGAGVANLASHLAWGVKNLFSAATTPVSEEDLNQ